MAERLNLSHAAEAMNMTQQRGFRRACSASSSSSGPSSITAAAAASRLTESGRALLRHAIIEAQLADARSEVVGIAGGKTGHARIGAGPSWLSRHLPESIARMIAQHPNVRFTVDTGFPDRLIGRLRLGELDVVVGALPDNRVDPDLQFMRLSSDIIRVVGRKEHPLVRKRDRSLADYAALLDLARTAGARAPAAHPGIRTSRHARADNCGRDGLPLPKLAAQNDRLPQAHDHADPVAGGGPRRRRARSRGSPVSPRGGHHQPQAGVPTCRLR